MKKPQNFKNHTRYYPFHHFIITPLSIVFLGWTFARMDFSTSESFQDSVYWLIGASLLVLIPLLARTYAIKVQNRVILSEMRMRYFFLTGKSMQDKEQLLHQSQLIALRFAADEELLGLMEKAIAQKLSSKEIKSQIKHWRGDYKRV